MASPNRPWEFRLKKLNEMRDTRDMDPHWQLQVAFPTDILRGLLCALLGQEHVMNP